jgi:type IV pilus assembly protein PilX
MQRHHFNKSGQRGAALVVGLMLLVVLTLLAISGMNTASTELVMASNEQYRQKAFQASSTGIEQAVTVLATVPQSAVPTTVPATVAPGETTDTYATSSLYMGDDLNLPGFSAGKFVGFHYQITSTGVSSRNSTSQQLQGAYVIQNAGAAGSFGSIVP